LEQILSKEKVNRYGLMDLCMKDGGIRTKLMEEVD